MVPYPQASNGTASGGLNQSANNNGSDVGNASVGVANSGETTYTGTTNSNPPAAERPPDNTLSTSAAAAAAAATAALAAASAAAMQQHQQQQNGGVMGSHNTAAALQYAFPTAPQHRMAAHVIPPAGPQFAAFGFNQASETPHVFQNMKLRRGKWTQEEEEYAAYLIKEFEKGTISGCENGCTLRAFLSKKLHCAPMRISKKYAGKSIGKHVFLSRKPGNGLQGITHDANNTGTDGGKLRQLELQFYKSLFQDRDSTAGSIPLSSPYSLSSFLPQTAGVPAPHINMFHHHHQMQFPPGAYRAYATAAPTLGSAPAPAGFNPNWPTGLVHPPAPNQSITSAPKQAISATSNQSKPAASEPTKTDPASMDETQKNLHQSYLDAMNQMQMNFMGAAAASQPVQQAPAANPSAQQQASQAPPAQHQTSPAGQQASSGPGTTVVQNPTPQQNGNQQAHEAPRHPGAPGTTTQESKNAPGSAMQYTAAPVQAPASNGGTKKQVTQNRVVHGANSVMEAKRRESPYLFSPCLQDLPDLLSGFDRVAASSKSHDNLEQNRAYGAALKHNFDDAVLSSQYSPPFTSRSFDDFHRLLGKDLLHQPLNIGNARADLESGNGGQAKIPTALSAEHGRGMPHPPLGNNMKSEMKFDLNDMSSTLTADAYAMFAQESALAVSQHSAYCRTDAIPSSSETFRSAAVIPDDESSCRSRKRQPQQHPQVSRLSSVVNAANLRAHAKAAEQTEHADSSSVSSKTKRQRVGPAQSYMRRNPHIVSASERSNSDMGTEESESALGSSRGSGSESTEPSDNTSNDSDSNSDDGPCLKKQKTCREEARREEIAMNPGHEVFSPSR